MSYTDTGLSPSTLYCYQIAAWNFTGIAGSNIIDDIATRYLYRPQHQRI
jgi:hypothetical protein